MEKKIDYEALENRLEKLMRDHIEDKTIPVPVADAFEICFSLVRLHQIELDLQGKFQEI